MKHLRWAEPALFALGLLLRLLLPFTFDVHGGADFWNHEHYARWLLIHEPPPPSAFSMEAFHPPGWYRLAAAMLARGYSDQSLIWISVVAGCARLSIVWWALRRVFPDRPVVRCTALALAALTASSLQVDGTVGGEGLHALLATAALAAVVLGLAAGGASRWGFALAAGLLVGIDFRVKVSALVVAGLLALAALLDATFTRGRPIVRLGRAAPWLWGLVLAVLVALPQARDNQRLWGEWFPSSFTTTQKTLMGRIPKVELLDRRPGSFYWEWDASLFEYPFASEDKHKEVRFWPTLVASSFVDHYGFFFVWPPPTDEKPLQVNFRPMPQIAFWPARFAFAGGALVALATMLAFFGALAAAVRRRNAVWLAGLALPFAALAGLLQFAVAYPFDDYGVVKGAYLQFAAAPLCALAGLALEFLLRRNKWIAGVLVAAIVMVGGYTLFARGVALLHPL
jgi:4-amino-4-deoxy-L-arabinose transferase-like glycosyltransferase